VRTALELPNLRHEINVSCNSASIIVETNTKELTSKVAKVHIAKLLEDGIPSESLDWRVL
jgi:hypothetical protein